MVGRSRQINGMARRQMAVLAPATGPPISQPTRTAPRSPTIASPAATIRAPVSGSPNGCPTPARAIP